MATSTVTAFRAALVSQLTARAGLSGVQVVYGVPAGALSREHILLGNVSGTQEYVTVGASHKYEDYDVTVHIGVLREGVQQQPCDERALALMAELEQQLRDDLTVGNTVLNAQLSRFEMEALASDTTREARVTATIAVRARM